MRNVFSTILLLFIPCVAAWGFEVESKPTALSSSVPISLNSCPDEPNREDTKGPGGVSASELIAGLQKSLSTLADRCKDKNFLSSINAYQVALQNLEQRAGTPTIPSAGSVGGDANIQESCATAADVTLNHATSAESALRWGLAPGPAGYEKCFCDLNSPLCGKPCIDRQRNQELMETLVRLGCNTARAMYDRHQIIQTRIGIIKDLNQGILNLADTPASCIQGPGGAEFIAGLLSTTSQTAAMMATLEPVSGVGSVGIGLGANLMNKMLEKIYRRNTAAFALNLLQTNLENGAARCFLRFASLYLGGCQNERPFPKDSSLSDVSPCHQIYFEGKDRSPDAPILKVLTHLNQIELDQSKPKVGEESAWDRFKILLENRILDPGFVPPKSVKLEGYLRTVADDLIHYANGEPLTSGHQWATGASPPKKGDDALMDILERAERLDKFLKLVDESRNTKKYNLKKRIEFRNQAVAMIKGTPAPGEKEDKTKPAERLDLAETLRRHWEVTLPHSSGLERLLAAEYAAAAMDRFHHQDLLATYQVVPNAAQANRPNAPIFERDSNRKSIAEAYTALVHLERSSLVDQLKAADRAYELAKTVKDQSRLEGALDEGASDLITLCTLPGPFYARTQGVGDNFAHTRVENVQKNRLFRNPLSSRTAFEEICKKVQCETKGGLPAFPEPIRDKGESDKDYEDRTVTALAKYQCELNAKLPQVYRKLRQNFRSRHSFCG
jgi:hypothetical protein